MKEGKLEGLKSLIAGMSCGARILLSIVAIVLFMVGIQMWTAMNAAKHERDQMVQEAFQGHKRLEAEADQIAEENLKIAMVIAEMDSVQESLGLQDRERLIETINPIVTSLNANSAFPIKVHFHLPPATSFLRVWKPEKFGDDLRGFRKTIVETLSSGKPVKGIEAGRVGLAIRGVVPIFWEGDDKPVGSVEVAVSLGAVAKNIANITGEQNALYALEKVKASASSSNLKRIGQFKVLMESDNQEFSSLVDEALLERALEGQVTREAGNLLLVASPVLDYQRSPTGVYVRFIDLSPVNAHEKRQILGALTTAAAAILFAIFIAWFSIKFSLTSPLERALGILYRVSRGELTESVDIKGSPEIVKLGRTANNLIYSTGEMLMTLKAQANSMVTSASYLDEAANTVQKGAKDLDRVASGVAASATDASSSLPTVASATDELTSATNEIAQSVAEAARVTSEAMDMANQTNDVIVRLGESSNKIGGIIQVINNIAEQTNLLALNATIEAARAGEAGKGFAVVANEVKELAKQTADATEEITKMIQTIQTDTKEAVASVDQITKIVAQVNDLANTIASAAEEQTATVSEINESVNSGAEKVKQVESEAKGMASQVEEFSRVADQVTIAKTTFADISEGIKAISDLYTVDPRAVEQAMDKSSLLIQLMGISLIHFAGFERMRNAVMNGETPDVVSDANDCKLTEWIRMAASKCEKSNEVIPRLVPVHEEFHRAAGRLKDMMASNGDTEQALNFIHQEMKPLFDEVMEHFRDLIKRACVNMKG